MQRYLSLHGDLVESYTPASQGSSTTQKSLFVENLLIAAEDPIRRFEILTKFVEKIVELAQANSLDHTSNQYRNLEIFDIANDLAEGKLEQEMLDFLRKALRLFSDKDLYEIPAIPISQLFNYSFVQTRAQIRYPTG
ncbi:hypothetical protein MauCBS54593_007970, partial [Microsporum audouinii]